VERLLIDEDSRREVRFSMATVPGCAPEERENFYAAMARGCNVHVPGTGQRLYAIRCRRNGDVWFATVGKTLTGRRPVWKGRKKTEETSPIEDPALVLAILPVNGLCWVATDGGAAAGRWQANYPVLPFPKLDLFRKVGKGLI
jgi:hypothetical protein